MPSRVRNILLRWRDTRLSDPRLMRLADATLLGRAIARHEARALFDVAAGFVYAQTLSVAIELGLFDALLERPGTTEELAARLDLPPKGMQALLVAAEPMRLVERRGDAWGLGRRGAAIAGNPGLVAMVRHHDMLYRELADPVALLRRGAGRELPQFWSYARPGQGDVDVAPYSALMAASLDLVAQAVLAAYPFGRHRQLLDVGGGDGVFARRVAERHPRIAVGVFDLPAVAERARASLADLGSRARAVGGNVFADPLPTGADVVSLVRIVHDHDDDRALLLLRNVASALPPGGTLVLAEPMAGSSAAPGIASYFSLYLTAMGSGRPRRPAELVALLEDAGFDRTRLLRDRNPTVTRVLTARRSESSVQTD